MKVKAIRMENQGLGGTSRRFTPYEAGSAAAGCGCGCIRDLIWIGFLVLLGYLLLATCTGAV